MKHHPNMGGDVRTMQAINAEYDCRCSCSKISMGEIRSKYGSEWLERRKEDEREKLSA